ncbi:MAG: YraN family protein [Acidimicrobiia bacterium]
MEDHRPALGRRGERIAEAILTARGLAILERNRAVGRGEIDLIARSGQRRVVVEVRTVRGELALDQQFPVAKRRQVHSLASNVGIDRVDLVGVALGPTGVEVHWLRNVAGD